MENKIYANTDNNTEFKTRLKVGEVVIVEYDDYILNYHRNYISVVKDIVIDKENNFYTCRLDNFNIDFELFHQVPHSINSGGCIDIQNKIYSNIYKIEDFEKHIQIRNNFNHTKQSLLVIIDYYKVLIEAMKLKEKLQQVQQ